MRVEGNLGSGNCRCKVPEMGGNLEHWRNRRKVRVTGTLCEREHGGRKAGMLAGVMYKLGLVCHGKIFKYYLKWNREL